MKVLLALTAVALPIAAQVTPSTGSAPATGAPTIAGPFGSGTVNSGVGSGPGAGPLSAPVGGTFSRPNGTFSRPLGTFPPPSSTLNSGTGFPPPVSAPVAPLVTNTGIGGFAGDPPSVPEASTFPNGAPPFAGGNTVGPNLVAPATNFPPRRALSVNLPPGSAAQTNAFGIPNPVTPPPGLAPTTPMNTVGAPSGAETGAVGPVGAPPVIAPPAAPTQMAPPPRNPGARLPAIRR